MPYTNIASDEAAPPVCKCVADNVVMEIPNVGTYSGDFEGSLTVAPGVQIVQDEWAMLPLAIRAIKRTATSLVWGRFRYPTTEPGPLP